METNKDPAHDSLVKFISDDTRNQIRQLRDSTEKGTFAIYIFTALSLLNFVASIFIVKGDVHWFAVAINILMLIIFLCLGLYSQEKPFAAFLTFILVVISFFLVEGLVFNVVNTRVVLLKLIVIIYIALRLEAAKKVQEYDKQNPRQKYMVKS